VRARLEPRERDLLLLGGPRWRGGKLLAAPLDRNADEDNSA